MERLASRLRAIALLPVMLSGGPILAAEKEPTRIEWWLQAPFRLFPVEKHDDYLSEFVRLKTPAGDAPPVWRSESILDAEKEFAASARRLNCYEAGDDACAFRVVSKRMTPGHEDWLTEPYALKARLLNAPSGECDWYLLDEKQPSSTGPCGATVALKIPYSHRSTARLTVKKAGAETVIAADLAVVQEVTLLGLGDSFGSGEGNPDWPAKFACDAPGMTPARCPDQPASWVDRRCHRSLFSPHARAAMKLATSDTSLHTAVSFIGLACSGAEIPDIIDNNMKTVEGVRQNGRLVKKSPAQLRLLRQAKLFGRTIDYVFLSIGGNDVGFAKVLAEFTLEPGNERLAAEQFGAAITAADARALIKSDRFKKNFRKLGAALKQAVRTRDHGEGRMSEPEIFITQYPDVFSKNDGNEPCGGKAGWEAITPKSTITSEEAREGREQVIAPLNETIREAAKSNGWQLVPPTAWTAHGYCAVSGTDSLGPFQCPALTKDGATRVEGPSCAMFGNSYSLTARWIRTANDVDVITSQQFMSAKFERIDDSFEAMFHVRNRGAAHPNALGFAAIADSIVGAVLKSRRASAAELSPAYELRPFASHGSD